MDLGGHAEWMARRIVGELLGVEVRCVDGVRPGNMLWDFELRWPDGRRGVLEATTCTDQTVVELHAVLAGNEIVPAPALSMTWLVWLAPDARYSDVHRHAERVLRQVEAAGWGHFDYGDSERDWPYSLHRLDGTEAVEKPAPVVAARRLGIRSAHACAARGRPVIILNPPHQTATASGEPVVLAAETEAGRNAEKLAAADVSEAHLFVWVDSVRRFDVEFAMSADHTIYEARPPRMPAAISDVWMAADAEWGHNLRGRTGIEDDVVVWHAENGGNWSVTNVHIPQDQRPSMT